MMTIKENKTFLVNPDSQDLYSFGNLFDSLKENETISNVLYLEEISKYFYNFLKLLLNDEDVILRDVKIGDTDPSFTLDVNQKDINLRGFEFYCFDEFISILSITKSKIKIQTSGTTGQPKCISHSISNLIRQIRVGSKYENNIWCFAYSPTHIAGIQVFFQALFNQNTIVNCFGLDSDLIHESISRYQISHISATPTFYRLIYKFGLSFNLVQSISLGGEKSEQTLYDKLNKLFPNAKIFNIYASTEAGTLFASNSDIFILSSDIQDKIKIIDNELFVNKFLLGESEVFDNDWYATGDLVEWIDEDKKSFKFLARKNEMINIGGNKVNPHDIEKSINIIDGVMDVIVYSKSNNLIGNILIADVIVSDSNISELFIKKYLANYHNSFEIPRIINFVNVLSKTRTGKLKRI